MKEKETVETKQLSLKLDLPRRSNIESNSCSIRASANVLSFPSREENKSDFRARVIADLISNKVIID